MSVTAPGPPTEGQTGHTTEDVFEVSLLLRDSSGRSEPAEMLASMAHISRNGPPIASRPYASMTLSPGAVW